MKLRPQTFEQFIGQDNLLQMLKIFVNICQKEKGLFRHCLFYGLPGTGKTSLANVIANELNVKCNIINAANLKKQADLISFFSLVQDHEVVFIDELHSLDSKIVELLYPMMEDFAIDILIGKDFNQRNTRLKTAHFTLIAATTSIGKIPKPLVDRFQLVYKLENYTENELCLILKNVQAQNKLPLLNDNEIQMIASHCKQNPRLAINTLLQASDFKKYDATIRMEQILKRLKIYTYGLTDADLEYLQILNEHKNKTLGIKTLIQITGADSFTIENFIEPYLFKLNLLQKTSKGRQLTDKAVKLLKEIKQ